MNFNDLKRVLQWLIIYINIDAKLISCEIPHHLAAPINKVYDNNNYGINNNYHQIINRTFKNSKSILLSEKIYIRNKNNNFNKSKYLQTKSVLQYKTDKQIIYNRNYHYILKGCYSGDTYIVKPGDTLFYIAWIIGDDYRNLAKKNKITEPYILKIGQIINVNYSYINRKIIVTKKFLPKINNNLYHQANTYITTTSLQYKKKILPKAQHKQQTFTQPQIKISSFNLSKKNIINIVDKWHWPTKGKIIETFSNIRGGNKGVDIAGLHGQPIFAAAAGKVVYSGNALRGYGNLIIIKHNNDYLTAYAHNDTVLIHNQQQVVAGQKIATMGSTGINSVRLHFEIRYKGESVNPLLYLKQK